MEESSQRRWGVGVRVAQKRKEAGRKEEQGGVEVWPGLQSETGPVSVSQQRWAIVRFGF